VALFENLGDLPVSIASYSDLVSAVPDWMQRPSDTTITTIVPDCIKLLESKLGFGFDDMPPLRIEDMIVRATASATAEYLAVPDDFLEVRDFKINTNPETHLTYVTPAQFAEAGSSYETGTPKAYTIIGDEFRFGPVPADKTAELWYYGKIPALTASNTSNWLLTKAPNVYLFGTLSEAYQYIGGEEAKAAHFHGLMAGAVRALQAQDRRRKYGNAPLYQRPVTPTP
jgi:hypothetical protein